MMTVRVQGGLGNQLHCLAFGLAILKKNEGRVVFDTYSGFIDDKYGRIYLLDFFPNLAKEYKEILKPMRSRANLKGLIARYVQRFSRVISKFLPLRYKLHIVERGPYKYRGELLDTHFVFDPTFQGYWAAHGYCAGIEKELTRLLWLPKPKGPLTLALLAKIKSTNSCFIHFRSYKEESVVGERESMMAYYSNAINLILKNAPDTVFYVFSDDVNIARSRLPTLDTQLIFVDNSEAIGNAESLNDFYLMRSCNNGIVGNSTYSWWAAWLLMRDSGNTRPLIIAPQGVSPWGQDWTPSEWTPLDAHYAEG